MSRSALWRQEANVQERERQAHEIFVSAVEEGRNCRARGIIPLHGKDDTFNLHPVLLASIRKAPYFLKCYNQIKDWTALVDEIYYEVKHVEPWAIGPTKMPSTAFCLLVRLFTLRCTEKQMKLMLDHVDSPYIRCIGFLYLRYAAEPKSLWGWFEPYLYDEEKVRIEASKTRPKTTVGAYARSLLTKMEYYGTMLPRLPVAIEREMKVKLLQAERTEDRAQKHLKDSKTMSHFQKLGNPVRALYGDEENPVTWYDAVVDRVVTHDEDSGTELSRPKFVVTFPEYGNTETVTLGEMDMPGTDSTDRQSPQRATGGQFARGDRRDWGDRDRGGSSFTRERRGNRRYEDTRGYRARDSHPRYRDRHYNGHDRRPRSRSRDRNTDYRPRSSGSRVDNSEAQLMEEVLRQEREKITAKGRAYASRPPSCKASLSVAAEPRGRKGAPVDDGDYRPAHRQEQPPSHRAAEPEKPSVSTPRKRTPEELAAIEQKKRNLMAKYG